MDFDNTGQRYLTVSWEQLHRDSRTLAAKIMERDNIKGLILVSRGGLVPAAIVARELEIRNVDTICIASYEEEKQEESARIIKCPEGDGEGYVVIDDLVDSGNTGRIIRKMLPKAYFATVYAKPKGQAVVDSFVVPVEQNVWILFPWDLEMQPNVPLIKRKQGQT